MKVNDENSLVENIKLNINKDDLSLQLKETKFYCWLACYYAYVCEKNEFEIIFPEKFCFGFFGSFF